MDLHVRPGHGPGVWQLVDDDDNVRGTLRVHVHGRPGREDYSLYLDTSWGEFATWRDTNFDTAVALATAWLQGWMVGHHGSES